LWSHWDRRYKVEAHSRGATKSLDLKEKGFVDKEV
jgi:hypothetical protein